MIEGMSRGGKVIQKDVFMIMGKYSPNIDKNGMIILVK